MNIDSDDVGDFDVTDPAKSMKDSIENQLRDAAKEEIKTRYVVPALKWAAGLGALYGAYRYFKKR